VVSPSIAKEVSDCILLIVALGLAVKPVQHAGDYSGGQGQQIIRDAGVASEIEQYRAIKTPARRMARREIQAARAGRGMRLRIVATYNSWWQFGGVDTLETRWAFGDRKIWRGKRRQD
jgi:hypothetical protein